MNAPQTNGLIPDMNCDPTAVSGGNGDRHLDAMSDREWLAYATWLQIPPERAAAGVVNPSLRASIRQQLAETSPGEAGAEVEERT